jgi:hypothetical protein
VPAATIYIRDKELWQRAEDQAKKLGISRSELLEMALRDKLARLGRN